MSSISSVLLMASGLIKAKVLSTTVTY